MGKFYIGEKVWLRKGSPTMKVLKIIEDGTIECEWFVYGERKTGLFKPEELTNDEAEID
jgi:uncharacterized protein YodC (DUF2158 family)